MATTVYEREIAVTVIFCRHRYRLQYFDNITILIIKMVLAVSIFGYEVSLFIIITMNVKKKCFLVLQ